jgi:hypothetical protein
VRRCAVRSDNIRADIDRIRSMPDEEFREKWGAWARSQDRDLNLMRRRWLDDLEHMLPFAEREDALLAALVAAKDAYRDDPNAHNRQRRDEAVTAVQQVRQEERCDRAGIRIAGDAFTGVI